MTTSKTDTDLIELALKAEADGVLDMIEDGPSVITGAILICVAPAFPDEMMIVCKSFGDLAPTEQTLRLLEDAVKRVKLDMGLPT